MLARLRGSSQDAVWVLDDGALAGVFTEHDAARVAAERLDPALLVDGFASTGLLTVPPRTTAGEMRALLESKWIRHLPIASTDKLLGVLSWRDLVGVDQNTPAGEMVYWPAENAGWGTPLRDIARRMVDLKIGSMPILEEDGTLDGLITRVDLIRALLANVEVS